MREQLIPDPASEPGVKRFHLKCQKNEMPFDTKFKTACPNRNQLFCPEEGHLHPWQIGSKEASDQSVIQNGTVPGNSLWQDCGHRGQLFRNYGTCRPEPAVAVVDVCGGRPHRLVPPTCRAAGPRGGAIFEHLASRKGRRYSASSLPGPRFCSIWLDPQMSCRQSSRQILFCSFSQSIASRA